MTACFHEADAMAGLSVVTLYVTERCNSRCQSCDYWRVGRDQMTLARVQRLLPSLRRLGTQTAVLSGGEPLMNPEWQAMAGVLRAAGIEVWLLTAGLALLKHAGRIAGCIDRVTVSLDGADATTYAAIRGVDAFDKVCEGIQAVVRRGMAVSVRVTVQRGNFRELPAFVDLARALGAQSVSFLAVDVRNTHAFARGAAGPDDLVPAIEELEPLEAMLSGLERSHAEDFRSRFIEESPAKLRRMAQYFAALHGLGAFPAVRCNAPEFSAVIGARGQVHPCFFIAGPEAASVEPAARPDASVAEDALPAALDLPEMRALRAAIRRGERTECRSCVCSLWRDIDRTPSRRLAAVAS